LFSAVVAALTVVLPNSAPQMSARAAVSGLGYADRCSGSGSAVAADAPPVTAGGIRDAGKMASGRKVAAD